MVIPNIVMKELNLQPGAERGSAGEQQPTDSDTHLQALLDELLAQCDMNAAELSEQDVWGYSPLRVTKYGKEK